jgi:hypothetical protein
MSPGPVLLRMTKQGPIGASGDSAQVCRRELGSLENIGLDVKPFARILCLSMIKDAKAAGFA